MASETSSHSDGDHHQQHLHGAMKRYRDETDDHVESVSSFNTSEPNPAWIKTPLFVTKTFEMLNDCDTEVASWTDDGEMFMVKDQAALAERYIPQFFGHSNFSSFDRQLNFYGFRKSYPDYLRPKSGAPKGSGGSQSGKDTPKTVFFHHEHFKRGRPDLFHLIKRASSKKPSKKAKKAEQKKRNEVDDLKEEIATLEENLQTVTSSLQEKFVFLSKNVEQQLEQMRNLFYEASRLPGVENSLRPQQQPSTGISREMSFGTAAAKVAANSASSQRRSSFTSTANDDGPSEGVGALPPLSFRKPEPKMTRVSTDEILKDLGPSILKPTTNSFGRMTTMDQLMSMDETVALPPALRQRPSPGFSRKTTDEILNCLNGPNEQDLYADDCKETSSASLKPPMPEKPASSKIERFSTADVSDALPPGLKPLAGGGGRMTTSEFLGDWMDTSRNTSIGTIVRTTSKEYADDPPHDATALLMLANQNIPVRRAAM